MAELPDNDIGTLLATVQRLEDTAHQAARESSNILTQIETGQELPKIELLVLVHNRWVHWRITRIYQSIAHRAAELPNHSPNLQAIDRMVELSELIYKQSAETVGKVCPAAGEFFRDVYRNFESV